MDDDPEGTAESLYRLAEADPEEPPGPHELASRLGLTITYSTGCAPGDASIVRLRGQWQILVRCRLSPEREVWAVSHEIAEWALRREPPSEEREQQAEQLAARILMPRAAFRRLVRTVGLNLKALAAPWPTTPTAAALRYLEVTDTPGAVVTSTCVRYRGPEWAWPAESEIRMGIHRGRELALPFCVLNCADGSPLVFACANQLDPEPCAQLGAKRVL